MVEFAQVLEELRPDAPVKVDVLRARHPMVFHVIPAVDEGDPLPLAARVTAPHNLSRRLEILGVTLDAAVENIVGPTRYQHGVVVAVRSSTLRIDSNTLQVRDIIYQVNGNNVKSVQDLRELLREIRPGAPLVLQIERDHNLYDVPLGAARQ